MPEISESVAVLRLDPLADFESAAFYAVGRGGFHFRRGSNADPQAFSAIRPRWSPRNRSWTRSQTPAHLHAMQVPLHAVQVGAPGPVLACSDSACARGTASQWPGFRSADSSTMDAQSDTPQDSGASAGDRCR